MSAPARSEQIATGRWSLTSEVQVPEITAVFKAADGMQWLESPIGNTLYQSEVITSKQPLVLAASTGSV